MQDGKIATPVPREGCAGFSGVPILAFIVRIGISVNTAAAHRVDEGFGLTQGEKVRWV